MDNRIRIVQDSKVFCRICQQLLRMGATSNTCDKGRRLQGNGRNTSCGQYDCENNVTLFRRHEKTNALRHRQYKAALRWKQDDIAGRGQNDDVEEDSYLMTVTEEMETKCAAELNDMIQARKEIHLKQGLDMF